ncbi:dihydrolipoamide dehydrogenase [Nitrosomonas eutropha]|uniref:dihydrolipoyl dehydrogenase n=1 Tax=Nitrosomonas eutropha TaxID=916 RepID=UPI0008924199|nr:dihydrolipoyl dehydrogenase [Nitrosomonas eutropha]SCX24968.1 dihydrolipoamide dehydrogenase [Nitrosomonas eutropha]SDW97826.1 dihydrolipoamide dehydrogenase [Nitrosomonas eutropha]
MNNIFDVAVIGAGPGGYVAAIRCAQLGLNTVCIDDWKNEQGRPSLGGTCLNVGCIPSKALLESSENFARAGHKFAEHGIKLDGLSIDVPAMIARKDKIVKAFTGGIGMLFKKNKVTVLHGRGVLQKRDNDDDSWEIRVKTDEKEQSVRTRHVIIATGSVPRSLTIAPVDGVNVLDNAGALALQQTPGKLAIIGAGVIGLELGSVWRRLGAEVTILEAQADFLSAADEQVAKEAYKALTRETGLVIHTGVEIKSTQAGKDNVKIEYTNRDKNVQSLEVDKLIVAVGRVPNTASLGAKETGLQLDERGYIGVDTFCQTSLQNVYAIGDVVRGPMLAHKASEEGVAVAERIASNQQEASDSTAHIDLGMMPWVIYTAPEIAWVGKTEQALKAEGVIYKVGQFPFMANGRARALGETTGFVKVLADAESDRILGVHMVGPYVSEIIAEAVVAMGFSASSEDLARIVHAHPSLSESLHEAALGVAKRTIHI